MMELSDRFYNKCLHTKRIRTQEVPLNKVCHEWKYERGLAKNSESCDVKCQSRGRKRAR